MSLDNALFLVDRGGQLHHVKGSDISTKIKSGDKVLVQRGGDKYHALCDQTNSTPFSTIQDTDLILVNDDQGDVRHVTGDNFQSLFGSSINSSPLKLIENNSGYMLIDGGMGLPTEPWSLESTNATLNNTVANVKFECQVDGELFYDARYSSEPSFDYLYININDDNIEMKSGWSQNTWNVLQNYQSVSAGDIIEIGYRKDSSVTKGYDKIFVDKLYLTEDITKISRYSDKARWACTYLGYPLCRPNWDNNSTWWGKFSICSGTSEDGWFFKSQYDSDGNLVGRFPTDGGTVWLMVNDRMSSLKSYQCIGDGKSTYGYYRFNIPDGPIIFSEGDNLYAFDSDPR